jgi:hypothetical protein
MFLEVTQDNFTTVLNKHVDFILEQERRHRIRSEGILKRAHYHSSLRITINVDVPPAQPAEDHHRGQ